MQVKQLCALSSNIDWTFDNLKIFYLLISLAVIYTGGFVPNASDVEGLFDREDDVFDLGQAVVLQDFSIWHRDVDTCYSGDWRIQVVEGRT